MLPTEQISEILTLELAQIVPMFDLPEAVMGVCNRRSNILWVVDLACLLDLEPLYIQSDRQQCSVIVIQQQQLCIGAAVGQLGQLIGCKPTQIQPFSAQGSAQEMPSKLTRCLQSICRNFDGTRSLILDGDKVLDLLKKG
jgi:positive phototaxis protein PixI